MNATIPTSYFDSISYLPSPSVSDEGVWLSQRRQPVRGRFLRSEALSRPTRGADQLLDAHLECSEPGWGSEALPVSIASLGGAK
jgi:hypothetical protein